MKRSPSNRAVGAADAAPARRSPRGGAVDRVVGLPRARRVAGAPVERPGRVDVAQAAGVQRVGGRLHHHDEVGGPQARLAREQRRQRALGDRQLLAPEEQAAEVDGASAPASASSIITASAPFMSPRRGRGRASAVAPARAVALRGTVSRWPASRTSGRSPRSGAGEHAGVAEVARPRRRRRAGRSSTCAASGASSRDSDGMSTARACGRRGGRPGTRPGTLPGRWSARCRARSNPVIVAGCSTGAGEGRRRPRTAVRGPGAPGRRACWASCRVGACAAG